MDASIILLADGMPCIVYNKPLPPVAHVEFCVDDFLLTFVFEPEEGAESVGIHRFEYPLDPPFVALLQERGDVAVGRADNGQVKDVAIVPVIFTEA